MLDGYLDFEHGQIVLGGVLLPGVLRSQSIGAQVRFDEAEQDGVSGKKKTPLGWTDAGVSLTLDLLSDDAKDCYAKLKSLNSIFKGHDNGGNPKVYTVTNPHMLARGIDQVVFSSLESSESDQDDTIQVTLKFQEHNPPIIAVEKRANASDQAQGAAPAIQAKEPAPAFQDEA